MTSQTMDCQTMQERLTARLSGALTQADATATNAVAISGPFGSTMATASPRTRCRSTGANRMHGGWTAMTC